MIDGFGTPGQFRAYGAHEQLLEEARTLVDNDRATGSLLDLDFDTAYGFALTLHEADGLPPVASKLPGHERGLNNLPGAAFFEFVEASDVVMQHGGPAAKEKAAQFIAEVHAFRPHLTELNTKLGIMRSVLGLDIEPGAEKSVPLQLVEQYLQPNGSIEEQQLAANALVQRLRTMS